MSNALKLLPESTAPDFPQILARSLLVLAVMRHDDVAAHVLDRYAAQVLYLAESVEIGRRALAARLAGDQDALVALMERLVMFEATLELTPEDSAELFTVFSQGE